MQHRVHTVSPDIRRRHRASVSVPSFDHDLSALPRTIVTEDGLLLVAATPSSAPTLWSRYVDGALASYTRHGVSEVLDVDEVSSGATTTLFYTVLDRSGEMLGGVRAQGPYTQIQQSHVLHEWRESDALGQVADELRARLPHGVVEMKTAWVGTSTPARAVSAQLARTALPTMSLTGARFLLASAADHVLRQWESSGGRIAENIPAAAYPSERYRTRMMWWDRHTVAVDARADVWSQMGSETHALGLQRTMSTSAA